MAFPLGVLSCALANDLLGQNICHNGCIDVASPLCEFYGVLKTQLTMTIVMLFHVCIFIKEDALIYITITALIWLFSSMCTQMHPMCGIFKTNASIYFNKANCCLFQLPY